MALITASEYAKQRGVTKQAVSKALRDGRISYTEDENGRKMIDPSTADQEWNDNTHVPRSAPKEPSISTDKPPKVGPSYADSRRIREAYQAQLAKLDFEERRGKLVSSDQVKTEAFKIGRAVREAILNVPDRIAAELAGETDQHKVHTRLREELEKALEELSSGKF